MSKKTLPTIKDLEFGKIAAGIYSEHRGEIMRNNYKGITFAEKIAAALANVRAINRRKARAARFANWPESFKK